MLRLSIMHINIVRVRYRRLQLMYNTQNLSLRTFFSPQILPVKSKFSQISAIQKTVILTGWLEEHKAQNVLAFDVVNKNLCMDIVVILTATSSRHAKGLADGILEECTKQNFEYLRMEGYQYGQWILVDLNDIVINIFQAGIRELYALETLWKGCPLLNGQLATNTL